MGSGTLKTTGCELKRYVVRMNCPPYLGKNQSPSLAGERGFEPLLYGPEPHVLPLDDSPKEMQRNNSIKEKLAQNTKIS